MAGLFDKQAEIYLEARPSYPAEWYKMLAELTPHHRLAWDVATGNGQAAFGVADHYEEVIATDISSAQLKHAKQRANIRYMHTPLSLSDDELMNSIGAEGSIDLITVAQAIHWFDLPRFYSIVKRLLRKPGGVIAVWGYNDIEVNPKFDAAAKCWYETTIPYWNSKISSLNAGYQSLPFPFESVGLGSEGNPLSLDIPKELSFEGYMRMVQSWSAVVAAKEQGVDLLSEEAVEELEAAWGGAGVVRSVVYKGFMVAGKVKVSEKITISVP
ncbi:S-adenosyl-L-methionine-dependent methyltransferases superfamily protein [Perilla frutescens var. frutescens]|nr:S-adenosyl-L-methionine-dependent methyltransferases superfamily protein [Perilla frutescens var. frutescens]